MHGAVHGPKFNAVQFYNYYFVMQLAVYSAIRCLVVV